MTDLTEDEKTAFITGTMTKLIPIIDRYQITDASACAALAEAFSAGCAYTLEQIKEQRE